MATRTDYGAWILEDDDVKIFSTEMVFAHCKSCFEEAWVAKTVAMSGWIRYGKCGRCYL